MHPLDGVTVVSIEQAVAAPFATRQLADLGARVIKVERPVTGDFARGYDETVNGLSSHFVWANRSKESVVLDLKSSRDRAVLLRLVATADVFVHNLAPGAVERLGLDAETLRASHPALIHCSISGYGRGGPYTDRKAYDLLVQCEAGLVSVTGTADEPAKVGISIADIAAGMYAYSGILTALLRRERTRQGAVIEVSMLDALAEWMGFPMYYGMYGGSAPPRTGAAHAAIAPYGPYVCGDGSSIFIGVQNEREWALFCSAVLKDPSLAEDPRFSSNSRRVANRRDLDRVISATFVGLSATEVEACLETAGIANARLREVVDLGSHPQLVARGRWTDVDSAVGPIRALLPPVILDGDEPVMGGVPALGEHTDRVLRELGAESPAEPGRHPDLSPDPDRRDS